MSTIYKDIENNITDNKETSITKIYPEKYNYENETKHTLCNRMTIIIPYFLLLSFFSLGVVANYNWDYNWWYAFRVVQIIFICIGSSIMFICFGMLREKPPNGTLDPLKEIGVISILLVILLQLH